MDGLQVAEVVIVGVDHEGEVQAGVLTVDDFICFEFDEIGELDFSAGRAVSRGDQSVHLLWWWWQVRLIRKERDEFRSARELMARR